MDKRFIGCVAVAFAISGCSAIQGDGAGGDCDAAAMGEELMEKSMALMDQPEKLEEYQRISKEVTDKVAADAADQDNELYSGDERCADLQRMIDSLDAAAAE